MPTIQVSPLSFAKSFRPFSVAVFSITMLIAASMMAQSPAPSVTPSPTPDALGDLEKLQLTPEDKGLDSVAGLAAKPAALRGLTTNYDKFKDLTTVLTKPALQKIRKGLAPSFQTQVMAMYEGKSPSKSSRYFLVFSNRSTDWHWAGVSTAILLVDGYRYPELKNGIRSGKASGRSSAIAALGGSTWVDEQIVFPIASHTVLALAKSKVIEAQIGDIELTIDNSLQDNLTAVLVATSHKFN